MGSNKSLIKYHKENQNHPLLYFSEKEENEMKILYKNSEKKFIPKKFKNVRYVLSQAQEQIKLGEGSFGEVIQKILNDRHGPINCAIKLFKTSSNKKSKQERIQNEIKILKMCNHKNIIQFYGEHKFKNDNNKFALFFECAAINLKDHLKNNKKIEIYHLKRYCFQILNALQYLHYNKISHGDIKPQNIMISERGGRIKLIDFGCAEKLDLKVKGTEMFLPPEFGDDMRFTDLGRDIWAFGITFFELLGGRVKIFSELKRHSFILNNQSFREELFKVTKNDDVVNDFLKCCLEEDPKKRKNAFQLLKHPFLESIANLMEIDTYTSIVTKDLELVENWKNSKIPSKIQDLNKNNILNVFITENKEFFKIENPEREVFKTGEQDEKLVIDKNLKEFFRNSIKKKEFTKEKELVSGIKSNF